MAKCRVLICAACGYQWDDEGTESTFFMFCPVCEVNLVYEYAPEKADKMGEEYDGVPWF